jgi:hypothetical protein
MRHVVMAATLCVFAALAAAAPRAHSSDEQAIRDGLGRFYAGWNAHDPWLAFVTDVSGRDEVWVASVPSRKVTRQVSIDGGTSPQWTAGGREIAYLSGRRRLTVRPFAPTADGGTLGPPRELFEANAFVETTPPVTPSASAYTAATDGRSFLAAVRVADPKTPPIQLVVNWQALLPR